jgi:hypothetical protein
MSTPTKLQDRRASSQWTPAMVTAIFGGLAVLVAAVLAGTAGILVQLSASRHADEISRAGTKAQLENITVLVDGTKSAMLRKIAVLMRITATDKPTAANIHAAEEAEREADEQEARVRAAIEATKAKAGQEPKQ